MADATLSRIEDITEPEENITIPEDLPSSCSTSTSASEYESMASRLLRFRSRGYRKRLSRSMEQISASSSHSAQNTENTSADPENSDSDADSLASSNVFGSQADQIKFLKDSLLQSHKELEQYKILNADLTKKLERCKKHGREVEKMLENVLWEKLKLYNKYKRLQRRFDVPETPPGGWEDSSPSDSSGGPGNGGRAGTPVRGHRKRRGDSPAGHRDDPGPSKRPSVRRCGLDRPESAINSSEEKNGAPSHDSGCSVADFSRSAGMNSESCYSESEGSSNSFVSQCSLQSALVDQDFSNNPDGSNDAQTENDVPSHVSPSESPDHVNEKNIFDDKVSNDGTVDPDIDDALHDNEDGDVCSRGSRLSSDSQNDEQEKRKSPEESPIEDKSDESCRSSIPRKRKSSTSLSSSGNSTVSKRRKSSSSSSGGSSGSTHSDTSDSHSDSSCLPASRSPSRSQSPPPPFRDAPRVIAPIPLGTRRLPRYWQRNGRRTSLRSLYRINYNDDDNFKAQLKGLVI